MVALALATCGDGAGGESVDAAGARSIATGLRVPWGIAFLPGGDALVSERTTGRILRISPDGRARRVVMRVPGVDTDSGEGGLLGLAVSPDYASDRWVYAYFTSAERQPHRPLPARRGARPVLTGLRAATIHNGGRIAFGPDGKLYAGVGDAGDSALAQDRGSLNGKILRMNPDGGVPDDNPFGGSLVWSLRPPQRAGPRLGRAAAGCGRRSSAQNEFDEVNLIRAGRNYGWPEVEGRGSTSGGRFTNPVVTWPTVGGLAERRGDRAAHALRRRAAGRGAAAGPPGRRPRGEAERRCFGAATGGSAPSARARRLALDRHLEPRRPRQPARRATTASFGSVPERANLARPGGALATVGAMDRRTRLLLLLAGGCAAVFVLVLGAAYESGPGRELDLLGLSGFMAADNGWLQHLAYRLVHLGNPSEVALIALGLAALAAARGRRESPSRCCCWSP